VIHVRAGRITEACAHHYDQHATDEFWALLVVPLALLQEVKCTL
jgi:hypothetical protein